MATVQIFAAATPFDEPSPSTDVLGDLVSASSTLVVIKNRDPETLAYDGTVTAWHADPSDPFVIDLALGVPVDGTVAKVEHLSDETPGATLLAEVTGLSVQVFDLLVALGYDEDVERYYETLLSGDDTFTTADGDGSDLAGQGGDDTMTGTDFDDVLDGGFGDNTLKGGAGDDILGGPGLPRPRATSRVWIIATPPPV